MNEIKCDACGVTAWPQMALSGGGKVAPSCPVCEHVHSITVGELQQGFPVDGERKSLPPVAIDVAAAAPSDGEPPPAPPPRAATPHSISTPAPARATARSYGDVDPIRVTRDRLTFLDQEDARLEGVAAETKARIAGIRAEAKRLRKMLVAAGGPS